MGEVGDAVDIWYKKIIFNVIKARALMVEIIIFVLVFLLIGVKTHMK